MSGWVWRNRTLLWVVDGLLLLGGVVLYYFVPRATDAGFTMIMASGVFGALVFRADLGRSLDLTPEQAQNIDPIKVREYRKQHPEATLNEAIRVTVGAAPSRTDS